MTIDRNESTQTQEGVNCVVKFSQVFGNRLRPCSDRLFVTSPEVKIQRKEVEEIMNTRFLRENTSSPTKVKNHDLPPVGFPHTSLFGLKHVTK